MYDTVDSLYLIGSFGTCSGTILNWAKYGISETEAVISAGSVQCFFSLSFLAFSCNFKNFDAIDYGNAMGVELA